MNLNHEQQAAVDAREGQFAVLAGPGSGKTTVLIARYHRLRDELVPAHEVLALTFTSKAAAQLRKRAGAGTTPEGERPAGFLTFHSLALSFATIERASFPFKLAPFPLATPGQVSKMVGQVLRNYPEIKFKPFLSHLSMLKRNGIRPRAAIENAVDERRRNMAHAYHDYANRCRSQGMLDFDDLIIEMADILTQNPILRDRWQYQHVMQDEAQDADTIQWRIITQLSMKYRNVFAVGDGNQAIYAWRGAEPELFVNFHKLFPEGKYLYLGQNYRSTPQIVEYIKRIAPIQNELIERFRTENPSGPRPHITCCADSGEEAHGVAAIAVQESGTTAILTRTNFYLRDVEDALASINAKYYLLGKSGYWQQSEIKAILAFVQCSVYPYDSALLAAIRAPFAGKYIRKKELIAALPKKNIWSALSNYRSGDEQQDRTITRFVSTLRSLAPYGGMTPGEAVPELISKLQARDYYVEEEVPEADNDPIENLNQLSKIASRFGTLAEFLEYAKHASHASRRRTGVALGTIHAAKGLEWDHVYLIGAQEGIMPHSKSADIDEEARIFFVAASRAAESLTISYVAEPSRFIQADRRRQQMEEEAA